MLGWVFSLEHWPPPFGMAPCYLSAKKWHVRSGTISLMSLVFQARSMKNDPFYQCFCCRKSNNKVIALILSINLPHNGATLPVSHSSQGVSVCTGLVICVTLACDSVLWKWLKPWRCWSILSVSHAHQFDNHDSLSKAAIGAVIIHHLREVSYKSGIEAP